MTARSRAAVRMVAAPSAQASANDLRWVEPRVVVLLLAERSDELHRSGGAVDANLRAIWHEVRRAGCTDHRGDAVLSRDDGGMRQDSAGLGDQRRERWEERGPGR